MERLAEQEFAHMRDRLYPMLMSAAQVQEKGAGQMVAGELIEGLFTVYVHDLDRYRVRYVTYEDLRDWGVSHTVLHLTCIQNLQKLTAPLRFTKLDNPKRSNPMFIWNQNDGYDAARLLLPKYLDEFAAGVSGNLIIGVPDRHWLVAAGDDDPRLIEFVASKVKERHGDAAFPVSPDLYMWADGSLVRYQ